MFFGDVLIFFSGEEEVQGKYFKYFDQFVKFI